jgi:FixJ family two-component response regulator
MDTVFVVDDDAAVRRSLERVLREGGFNVEAYESAEAFLARPDSGARGCLVLDVSLPGLDGLALQRRLGEAAQALPIVFLTGHGDIPMSVEAMKAGASDFLTKPVASETLLHAVRATLERSAATAKARAEVAEIEERFAKLSAREREVLAAVVDGKLNKQIAADLGVIEQTIKFHRARIMERMHARTVAELMHMAARIGPSRKP